MPLLTDRYADKIRGVLSCWDRVVLTGTIPEICYADAMARHLGKRGVRLFDFPKYAEPLRDEIRENAERIAREAGLKIDHNRRKDFRKEERIKEIVAQRGDHPGLVHIFSAMESCTSFRPWHDKQSHRTFLKHRKAQCIHYYFYFIDEELGLCYLRVPTWAPFRVQFYFNGHNWLAAQLNTKGVAHRLVDNAFFDIEDFAKAQEIVDRLSVKKVHRRLDRYASLYCPVIAHYSSGYHWSLMQVEYATDVVFHKQSDLQPIYEAMTRTVVHAVKADDVATFLGRKLTGNYQDEVGNDYHIRIQGTRIRHHMGSASIKMYDKLGQILRIETTSNDVGFFKHRRKVEHRDGTSEMKIAPVRKSIYSLPDLADLLGAANRRYLEFVSALDDPTEGIKKVRKLADRARENGRTYRGFNLFSADDLDLMLAISRGEHTITGFQNRQLRSLLGQKNAGQVSRMIKRLRLHGLVKKVAHRYKYYLTRFGRHVVTAALNLREMFVIPALTGENCP